MMKHLIISTLALLAGFAAVAEDTADVDEFKAINDSIMATLPSIDDLPMPDGITRTIPARSALQKKVQAYPEFPGGTDALEQWKKDNLIYTREAYESRIWQSTYMIIHITESGDIDSACIFHKCPLDLADKIALNSLCRMPRWQPAVDLDGNPTDYWYYIGFRISHPEILRQWEIKWNRENHDNELIEYGHVRMQPQFPGGEAEMYKWIKENIDFDSLSPEAVEVGGRVTVNLIVDFQGNITKPSVVKSKHPELDAEALRVVNSMPRWQPAFNDTSVDCRYILPINFRCPPNQ